jgi:hypothetical protein
MSLLGRAKTLFDAVRETPARVPEHVSLAPNCVDDLGKLGAAFTKDNCYFQVRVNEMFLASEREWLRTYYPMALFGSEFIYDSKETEIPFVVGPTTLIPQTEHATGDVLFRNTRVAGLHPYRGGRLCFSLILYRLTKQNIARQILGMVENLAGAVDFSASVGAYTKLAGALLDGVETLAGMQNTTPVLGHRIELDPDAGDLLQPGYFALVDMPENELRRYELRVRGNRLVHGPTFAEAEPFRAADFVLYSLSSTDARTDVDALHFQDLWQRVRREAAVPKDESYQSAKSNMLSLYQTMLLSSDLLPAHARKLAREYAQEMRRIFDGAVEMAPLGHGSPADALEAIRDESLKILQP